MSNRPPNERGHPGPGSSPHDASSTYKRSRPQSPSSSGISALSRGGAYYPQDPARFAMTAAALGVPSYHHPAYRADQFQTAAEQYRASTSRDADLLQIHKQRRPTMLDYPHGQQHAQAAGVDRARYRPEGQPTYGQHYGRQENMGNLQPHHTGPQPGMSSAPEPGPQAPKRPRLTAAMERPDLMQPLRIDTSQSEPAKREPAYNPQVEAISPTLPPEETLKAQKIKEEISEKLNLLERDIAIAKQQIATKKKKLQQQEEAANKEKAEEDKKEETPDTGPTEIKHQSIAQIIYAENRKKAEAAHAVFAKMGPKITAPLYNQPSDTEIYHINKKKFQEFKPRLILHFKKRHQARRIRERYLTQRYDQLLQVWLKKVEKWENNPKRKQKDAKMREYFEKIFPEIKKARDDKERLSRFGRSGMAQYARSEAELEQIMDGLHEQEEEDRKMRALAVIPPMMLDARQRSLRYVNNNGLMEDPMEEYRERRYINVWTAQEKQIFKEKYLQHPKNFALISSFLEKKSTMDCVQYYYLSKKSENYKGLLRKQSVKKKRQMAKPQAARNQDDSKEAVAADIQPVQEAPPPEEEAINIVSTGPSVPPLRPDTGPLNIPGSTVPGPPQSVKDEDDNGKDGADESSDDNDNQAGAEQEGGAHQCAVCKTQLEHYGLSRPLTQANCEMYGINEGDLKPDMRACNNCRCKSVNKNKQCPVPGCKTPKRKVKRLRPLPAKWTELVARNDPILKELQLTEDIVKCCSACFNRIARKLGSVAVTTEPENPVPDEGPGEQPDQGDAMEVTEDPKWTDEEIQVITKALQDHGHDWSAVANTVGTKSEAECESFFNTYKKKYNLEASLDKNKPKPEEDRRTVSICESIATTVTATSDVDNNFSDDEGRLSDDSGTASAPSPSPLPTDDKDDKIDKVEKMDIQDSSTVVTSATTSSDVSNSLTSHKPLSTSHGSLRSIPDNDSQATLSADEDTRPRMGSLSDRHGPHAGSIPISALPICSSGPHGAGMLPGSMGSRMPPGPQQGPQGRPHPSPSASPGNSGQGFHGSRPGSARMSPANQGQGHQSMSRPNSRPSSHEVPIVREANTTSDFPQQPSKSYSPYLGMSGREAQPHRPSSTLSEPGLPLHRALSPHVQGVQVGTLLGADPSRALSPHTSSLPPGDRKGGVRSSTCVRDLIHSAIERNLNKTTEERPVERQPERPRSSTETGYPTGGQPMPGIPTDLRKDRPDPRMDPRDFPDQRAMYQQMHGRPVDRSPRDSKDPRGGDYKPHDLSLEKGAHGYKGDPRDFEPQGQHRPGDPYGRRMDDPQQRKVISMVTPPPAHSSHRRSPFQDPMAMKARQESHERGPGYYPERQTLSPSVRSLPPSTSPYNPMGIDPRSSKSGIPPPPPLYNTSSPRLPRSPPGGQHMQSLPSGSITHGTPIGHAVTTTIPSSSGRHYEHGQQVSARGSITQGTPIRDSQLGRGSPMGHDPRPRMPGQYDIRMVEQAQARGIPAQMYDPRVIEQMRMQHPHYQPGSGVPQYSGQYPSPQAAQGEGHSKQLMSDFELAKQMRHQTSPTEKDVQRSSPRAPDQSPTQKVYHIDPRLAHDPRYHTSAPGGMFVAPQQGQPSSSRISPRPSPNMPSPRDDKTASPWMMAQAQRQHMAATSPGAHSAGHPSPHPSPHMEQGHGQGHQYPSPAQGRPSITQGTGRQTVITDSRGDDRYSRGPDSSSSHHSPRLPPEGYPTSSGDHRPSPGTHPDMYRQQQQQQQQMYEREKIRQEEAVKNARNSYEKGLKEFMKQQAYDSNMRPMSAETQRSREDPQAAYKKQIYERQREIDQNKQSPKLSNATDILKAFAPDTSQKRMPESTGKGGKNLTTAANLIDAIIVHQINQTTEETAPSESQPVSAQSRPDGNQPDQQRPLLSQAMSSQQQPGQGQGQQVQGYQGQPGQGQLQAQQGKRRWLPTGAPAAPSGPGNFPQGAPSKPDDNNRVASSTTSPSEGKKDEKKMWSIPLGAGDPGSNKQMTLGDHINNIIQEDYKRKQDKPGPPQPSLLSQINGSIQQTVPPHSQTATPTVSSSNPGEMASSWSTSPLSSTTPGTSPGSADSQGKPFPKKFKWRQTSEQASSSGEPVEGNSAVTQSNMEDTGARTPAEGEWRQMKPDQSSVHSSPGVAASSGLPPVSPQGQPDSSSNSVSGSSDGKAMRKGLGIQDSEVSTLEYVKNKIASCMTEDGPAGKGQGQAMEQGQGQQVNRGQQHLQLPVQQGMLQGRPRPQSPVSSQGMGQKEGVQKYPRPGMPMGDTHGPGGMMRPEKPPAPSSSTQQSPDQHYMPDQQSPVQSSGGEQVHSSQHPHQLGKKRMFSRPRSRAEQEEAMAKGNNSGTREQMKPSPRASPSAMLPEGVSGRVLQPGDKKGPRSAYDFPDSPDDEAVKGKPLSSYMALSSTTRSPRRGVVDSSENRSSGGGESSREEEGNNVESSGDVAYYGSKVSESGSSKDNEAQGFERYSAEQREQMGDNSYMSGDQGRAAAMRKQSLEADEGSNISHTSADSTDKLMIEETASIDSSSAEVSSISHKATGSRRSSKSSRESDASPHPGADYSGMTEHVSHSRQTHRSRSPRSYPHSSSDLPTSMASSNISSGFVRRVADSDGQGQQDQEPQPLLSSQYETLSDEEN